MSEPTTRRASPYGWRIGTLGGVPVYLGRSWPVIAILMVALFGPNLDDGSRPRVVAYLIAFAYVVLLLVSVLFHEAAHALAARWRGQRVDRVVADMWGGHTVYDATATTPGTTALVAVVGPLTNLLIAGLGALAQPYAGTGTASQLLGATAYANLVVGGFNLLPGLPMDGGQIVSALVWRVTGRRSAGLTAAGWAGRVVALGTALWGVFEATQTTGLSGSTLFWFAIAAFLWKGASDAVRSGPLLDATAGSMRDVLDPAVLVRANEPIEAGIRRASTAGARVVAVVVDAAGTPVGTMDPEAALAVAEADRFSVPVSAVYVAQPATWVLRLRPTASLADLVRAMLAASLSAAAVVDEANGTLLGIARAERMNDFIESELARRRSG